MIPRRRRAPGALAVLLAIPFSGRPIGDVPSGAAHAGPEVWIERETHAMGTWLRMRVAAPDREAALLASEAIVSAVRETDELLSTWRAGTALASINAAPEGRPVRVGAALVDLLDEIRGWSRATGGAFDPAIGALVDAWGLRGEGRDPTPAELERARASTGLACFELDGRAGAVTRSCPEARLDAGAFGKGVALRRARRSLAATRARSALVDFGGHQLAVGPADARSGRAVDVAHPSRRARRVLRIGIASGSIATSGQSERTVSSPRGRIGHVLDPRSGWPVTPWGSVTVVSGDPVAADILSTALFVMGPSEGLEWLRDRPEVAALFLVEEADGLRMCATETMRTLLVHDPPADDRDGRCARVGENPVDDAIGNREPGSPGSQRREF